jgi:hypothetical protein
MSCRRGAVPRRRPRAGPAPVEEWPRRDGGTVTAETAAALPVLVVVLVAAVWAVGAAAAQLRCTDAAREAARALARGDGIGTSRALAVAVAPAGAAVRVSVEGDLVRVRVSALTPLPAPLAGLVPAPTVSGSAVAMRERPLGGDP